MAGPELSDICERVRRIRWAFGNGMNQEEFAASLGIGGTAWSNYEVDRRPGLDSGMKIVLAFPELSLDWLYLGNPRGVPFDTLQALRSARPTTEAVRRPSSVVASKKVPARTRTRRASV